MSESSVVLVTARSFGVVSPIGREILARHGYKVVRVPDKERPLTSLGLQRYMVRERPCALVVGAEAITRGVLAAAERLRIITKHGVGVDNIDLATATDFGILVTNAPGTNAYAVAELTVALMLALSRRICQANQSAKAGLWERFVGEELWGKRIGVVGTGNIGKEVVERVRGFGVSVLAYDPVIDPGLASEYGISYVPMDLLLQEADYVTVHVPLVEATRNLIGETELGLMKSTAYLINVSRGGIVDEQALYAALTRDRIAGAALDVFADEPPVNSPLLELDNVLVTPHMGGRTHESVERMGQMCAENIVRFFQGGRPQHVVNPEVIER